MTHQPRDPRARAVARFVFRFVPRFVPRFGPGFATRNTHAPGRWRWPGPASLALCLLAGPGLTGGLHAQAANPATPPGARPAPAPSALTRAEARAVRTVIEAQLAAFAASNAEKAFSYASPELRKQFGSASTFMTMVINGYPMVVSPAAVAFFQPEREGSSVVQTVQMRDRDGALWLATYQLLRQPGGGWRIGGCVVLPDTGKSST